MAPGIFWGDNGRRNGSRTMFEDGGWLSLFHSPGQGPVANVLSLILLQYQKALLEYS